MGKYIEYFYAAHSAFAYIGSAYFMKIAERNNYSIVLKPMDLARVMAESGAGNSRDRPMRHRAYYFGREIERWAEWRGVTVMKGMPTTHRNDITLANCSIIAAIQQGKSVDNLAHRYLEAHWVDDADLSDSNVLELLIREAGLDPAPLLSASGSPETAAIYKANTEEAIARSVFGSPTYFVDGDMFYGQDHLDMLERALTKPFAGTWPRVELIDGAQ